MITIAIPTFNDATTVADTLASLVRQSHPVGSVLVIDDASSDDTVEVVRGFQDFLPLRILQNNSNLGLVGNWNRCLLESGSKFTWILHSDDWLHPNANDILLRQLEKFHGGLVYVGARFFADPECVAALEWSQASVAPIWENRVAGCDSMQDSLSYICSGVVVADAAYQAVGGFSARFPYSPDEELWLRIARKHQSLSARAPGLVAVRSSGMHFMHETWRRLDFKQKWWELHDELLVLASEAQPEDKRDRLRAAIISKRDDAWKMVSAHSTTEPGRNEGRPGRLPRLQRALSRRLATMVAKALRVLGDRPKRT